VNVVVGGDTIVKAVVVIEECTVIGGRGKIVIRGVVGVVGVAEGQRRRREC
jgi:hypothetical protein